MPIVRLRLGETYHVPAAAPVGVIKASGGELVLYVGEFDELGKMESERSVRARAAHERGKLDALRVKGKTAH